MTAVVVVGAQWGDEGKGKIVDIFTEHADMVVRYGGGPNAGHTLVVGNDKLVVRLIPSGILRANTTCVLAQGMAIDPGSLVSELDELARRGLVRARDSLVVSDRAHAILSYHVLVDGLREKTVDALGTTKRGVGPCYEDKVGRRGLPLGALRDLKRAEEMVTRALAHWAPLVAALGGKTPTVHEVMQTLRPLADRIVPMLAETSKLVERAVRDGKRVLFEGAQGTLLDIDHGTYPFVTSSSATAGGAITGTGVGPTAIGTVIGVTKAYVTRVGEGPFPTESHDEAGEMLRARGNEFGAVTGRPRRCGWLDLPLLRYSNQINGTEWLVVTKLDVLDGLDEIPVCIGYEIDGKRVDTMPADVRGLESIRPIYTKLKGWQEPTEHITAFDQLPQLAQDYLRFLEEESGARIGMVSTGPDRDQTMALPAFAEALKALEG
jgi:adenylosuccinate synthase